MRPLMSDRESTAYHEAGHAVIGRVLKLPCGPASIEPDHDSSGHSMVAQPHEIQTMWGKRRPHYSDDSVMRARIMAFMAGAEAEKEFGFLPEGDSDDRYQIACMLEGELLPLSWSDEKKERYEQRLRSKTRGLVRRHRQSVERVAKALLKHGTLQADEIDELISRP